ncbi:hypothetical protein Acid7E03_26570 [Acidisoma sp. 7E03]
MDTVDLVRVGKGANAESTKQRLIAIITTSLRMEAEQEAKKFTHEAISPSAFPSRMAA